MSKVDFKKELKHLYRPSAKEFAVVDVSPMNFLMIDGHGDPNTAQEYKDAVEALYAVAFRIKFISKNEVGRITLSHLWRGCGGQRTWRRSLQEETKAHGIGR